MSLRHDFYETDEKLTISIFDKGADPSKVSVKITARSVTYENEDKRIVIEPLKGDVSPDTSDYTVGKVKIEVRLSKVLHSQGRWGKLLSDPSESEVTLSTPPPPPPASGYGARPRKNWDAVTETILKSDKEKSSNDDPNAGGDAAVNGFFQKLYSDADGDTQRAMMKSYVESGGTTLSTNWDEVGKDTVTVKPPEGSEWRKWG